MCTNHLPSRPAEQKIDQETSDFPLQSLFGGGDSGASGDSLPESGKPDQTLPGERESIGLLHLVKD
jgi:hypothetical protein